MSVPLLAVAMPLCGRMVANCMKNPRKACHTLDDDLLDNGEIVGVAYCARPMLDAPGVARLYNRHVFPVVDAIAETCYGTKTKSATHGYLLIFVSYNDEIVYIYSDFGPHSCAFLAQVQPFQFDYKVFMGVLPNKTLRDVLDVVNASELFDVFSNNCKNYCARVVCALRGGPAPRELLDAFGCSNC